MKKLTMYTFILLLTISFAFACPFNQTILEDTDGLVLSEVAPGAKTIIGNNKFLKMELNGTHYFGVKNGIVSYFDDDEPDKLDYLITTDACTVNDIKDGTIHAVDAYNEGKVKLQGLTFGSKTKVFLGSMLLKIVGLFV
jgi:hypothetical protein